MRRRWAWGCSQHATTMMTRSYPTCSMSNPTNYWFLAPGELKRVIIPLRHRAATSNGDRTGVRGEGPSKSNHHSENPQAKDLPALTTWHPWKMLSTHGRPAVRPSVCLSRPSSLTFVVNWTDRVTVHDGGRHFWSRVQTVAKQRHP